MEAGQAPHLEAAFSCRMRACTAACTPAKRVASKRSTRTEIPLVHESIETRRFASNAPKQRDITTEAGCAYYYSSQQH